MDSYGVYAIHTVCVHVHVHMGVGEVRSAHGGQRLISSVFLYRSIIFFETQSVTEPGKCWLTRLAGQRAPGTPSLHSAGVTGVHHHIMLFFFLNMGANDLNCGPLVHGSSLAEPSPWPRVLLKD